MFCEAVTELYGSERWYRRARLALLDTIAESADADEEAAFLAEGYAELGKPVLAHEWGSRAAKQLLQQGSFDQLVGLADGLAHSAPDARERAAWELLAARAALRAGREREALEKLDAVDRREMAAGEQAIVARMLRLEAEFATLRRSKQPGEISVDPVRLIADADELGDVRLTVEARVAAAEVRRDRQALGWLEAALTRLGQLPYTEEPDLRYRVHALRLAVLYALSADTEQWHRAAEAARQVAEAAGSRWAALDVQSDAAAMEAESGQVDQALRRIQSVIEQARAARLGAIERTALVNRAATLNRAGRHQAALDAAQAAAKAARQAGSWRQLAAALSVEADALSALGQHERAVALLDESIDLKRAGGDARLAFTLLRRAEVHDRLGNHSASLADGEEALASARDVGATDDALRARVWVAVVRTEREGPSQRAALEAAIREAEASEKLGDETQALLERAWALRESLSE
jgi:tetratricopeptide (TPR) repeat protein